MESIKSILTTVLKMSVPEFVFDGRDQATQAGEVCIRSTLLEAIFGAGEFAILKARQHPDVGQDVFKYRLECTLAQGIEYQGKRLKALGAGSSLKDGKIWLGTERAISTQQTAEQAPVPATYQSAPGTSRPAPRAVPGTLSGVFR